ncbi:MAG: hypothetical protein KGH94_05275 [Candidatus Micrarchaeota archaeon]|nr:hypothetical protein [Candidatus Micrarchaeota archaeon]
MDRLSVKGLALGFAVPWALCILAGGWMSPGWASGFVHVFATVYPGYGSGFVGGIVGGIEAFFDAAIAGAIVALVYNWSANCEPKRRSRR